jgi:hypothetical protein
MPQQGASEQIKRIDTDVRRLSAVGLGTACFQATLPLNLNRNRLGKSFKGEGSHSAAPVLLLITPCNQHLRSSLPNSQPSLARIVPTALAEIANIGEAML